MSSITRRFFLSLIILIGFLFAVHGECSAQNTNNTNRKGQGNQSLQFMSEKIPDWQARLELARLLSYTKEYDESIANYRKVLAARPDLFDAKAELAKVLAVSGHNDEAAEILKTFDAAQLTGSNKLLLADIYALQKDYAKAEPLYREIIREKPENQEARLRLAEMLSWAGQYKESLGLYEIILKALPDDIQVRRQYAQVLSWADRPQDAIRELRRTLEK